MAETEAALDRAILRYRRAAYSNSTKAVYRSQLKRYLDFCNRMGYKPVPASESTLCRYVADLAVSVKVETIKQYLNVVRLVHLESGLVCVD